ncbi:MAG TPA: Ig-like domain-containing protein [Kofleriaceae bacterium]|nr:Ig-like domain-containing protein [Kofleriaceae bacterium]
MKVGGAAMKSWSFAILLAAGCQAPAPYGDFYLPDNGPVGEAQQAVTVGDGANGAHIIFLNFDGAALKPPGQWRDNSATNESQIAKSAVSYPAFNASPYAPAMDRAAATGAIATHFLNYFKDFNVEIVTTRPAGKRYTMCMIGGTPGVVGIGGAAAGVAPLDCDNNNEPDVVYAFSEVLRPQQTGSSAMSLKAIASTCAQEVAHAFGLGHTNDPNDVMYPQLTAQTKGFTNSAVKLVSDGSGQCSSPSTTQNSYAMMVDILGSGMATGGGGGGGGGMTGPAPIVGFVTPVDGSTVPLTFDIEVAAAVQGGTISRIEVGSGGQTLFTLNAAPWKRTVTAPQAGTYEISATAYDATGNSGSATVSFTAKAGAPPQKVGCDGNGDCNAPLTCVNHACVLPSTGGTGGGGTGCSAATPCPTGETCQADGTCKPNESGPKPGEIGATCTDASQCNSGLCADEGSKRYCTTGCDPKDASSCPSTTFCALASGSDYICKPKNANRGGGCSALPGAVGRGTGPAETVAILALCFALILTLRRRASR